MDSLNRKAASLLELTTTNEWNYVQSCDTPADAGTRGLSATALPTVFQVATPIISPTAVPAVSVPSLTVPMTSSTTSYQIINTPNQAASQQPSWLFNPTASVPVSHILRNLSA